jgi:resolvase-like protein
LARLSDLAFEQPPFTIPKRIFRLDVPRRIINAICMLTIGYVRVSTDRQAKHGVSLEAQEAKIRAMANVQGAELIDVIVDGGESAKSLNRPGLQRRDQTPRERQAGVPRIPGGTANDAGLRSHQYDKEGAGSVGERN